MDRGHWAWNVIVTLVLAGASVLENMKRCAWFPMIFGQVLKKNDKRMSMGEMRVRRVVKKMVPINKNNNAHVMATSCRNGNGNEIL